MRIGYRSVLPATVTLMALIAWGATSARPTAQAGSVKQFVQATTCATSAYHVVAGENATMTVKNDGGWCWVDTYERSYWHALTAHGVAVTNPPKHGHVLVHDIANQEVRSAYQPEPGFAGQDSFIIHYDTDEPKKTFLVAVSEPSATQASDRPQEHDFVDRRTAPKNRGNVIVKGTPRVSANLDTNSTLGQSLNKD
jgi:hypothetical protein